jgi:hypothetical protein
MIIHVSEPLLSGVEQVHIRLEKNEPMSEALRWAWNAGYAVIHMEKRSFLAERPIATVVTEPPTKAYERAPDPTPDPLITVNGTPDSSAVPDPLGALTGLADILGLKTQAEDWARTALLRAAWQTMQTAANPTASTPTPAAPQPVLPFTLNDVTGLAESLKNSQIVKEAWGTFTDTFSAPREEPADEPADDALYDEFLNDDDEPMGKHAKPAN